LVANFSPFCKKYFEKAKPFVKHSLLFFFWKTNCQKNETFAFKISSIAYNTKGCLRFFSFIFWISPNLAKYTYGWLSLEQHHKIGKNKNKKIPNTKPNPWELKDKKSQLKYQNPLSKRHAQVGFRV